MLVIILKNLFPVSEEEKETKKKREDEDRIDRFHFWLLDAVGVSMIGKETKEKQNIESTKKHLSRLAMRKISPCLLVCSLSISSLFNMNYKKKLYF